MHIHNCKYITEGKDKVVQGLRIKLFLYDISPLLSIHKSHSQPYYLQSYQKKPHCTLQLSICEHTIALVCENK